MQEILLHPFIVNMNLVLIWPDSGSFSFINLSMALFLRHIAKSVSMEKFGLAVVLLVVFAFTGCHKEIDQEGGFLEGVINIGPICPVESEPNDPACRPTADTYKAYPVGVWTTDLKTRIARINPSLDGSFTIEMVPGNYIVILETGENSIAKSNLPFGVTILPASKTIIDINIDTGIR